MWNITIFDELPSTQTFARERLDMGAAKHGDVIQALHQTAGRGRYANRLWIDSPGDNLLLSIILTELPEGIAERTQFAFGLAALRMFRSLLGETSPLIDARDVRLKWTNDLLIERRKIAGILSEAVWSGNTLRGVVVGIGINVNQYSFEDLRRDFQPRNPATSLRSETNFLFSLDEIRTKLLHEIENVFAEIQSAAHLMDDVRRELEWMRHLESFDAIGSDGASENNLQYETISDDGSLWARNENGDVRTFQNATIILGKEKNK